MIPDQAPAKAQDTTAAVLPGGLLALIAEIQAGTAKFALVPQNDESLKAQTPWGTFTVSNAMYLSDSSAAALAQILGGSVAEFNPSGSNSFMPLANYIQIDTPGGVFSANAAVLASYSAGRGLSAQQLAFDLTQCINQNTAVITNGGAMWFPNGWAGPMIPGFSYPPGQPVGSDGNLANPAWIF